MEKSLTRNHSGNHPLSNATFLSALLLVFKKLKCKPVTPRFKILSLCSNAVVSTLPQITDSELSLSSATLSKTASVLLSLIFLVLGIVLSLKENPGLKILWNTFFNSNYLYETRLLKLKLDAFSELKSGLTPVFHGLPEMRRMEQWGCPRSLVQTGGLGARTASWFASHR